MKKTALLLCAIVLALTFASCDSKGRLAKNIEGSWAAAPEKLPSTDPAMNGTIVSIYEFLTTPGETGGTLNYRGLVSIMTPLQAGSGIEQNISMTASGILSATGTWNAIDDDEIAVFLDPASINVSVDSSAVVLQNNVLSQTDASVLEGLRPAAAEHVRKMILLTAGSRLNELSKIDDIKISDKDLMKFEIGKRDITLRRQTK